ncbi:MAG: hypothetical protein ACUVRJ_08320 [Candidatus Villigracilaceae bacterium]
MPAWALTLVFWLHMLATVTWLGGLSAVGLLVLPAAQRSLTPEAQAALQRRQTRLLYINLILSALILGATALARVA